MIFKTTHRPPIWFMRQAGRYHKHYQALRRQHPFMELCKNPDLAAQVAMGPIEDFDFDVAILFSDLLFPLEALGMGLEYTDQGPRLGWNLNEENIKKIFSISIDDAVSKLSFQKEALLRTRKLLPQEKSLIGFVGAPWTLFTYAVQGRHDGSLVEAKKELGLFQRFCEVLSPLLIENIRLQFEGGAEVVMLFDTAAGELSPLLFQSLLVPELGKLTEGFPGKLGYYAKGVNSQHLNSAIFKQGAFAGLGFDHRWDISQTLKENLYSGFKQGSFDQALLFLKSDALKEQFEKYLSPFLKLSREERKDWVCGLGHGVLPATPEENVKQFVLTVREAFS